MGVSDFDPLVARLLRVMREIPACNMYLRWAKIVLQRSKDMTKTHKAYLPLQPPSLELLMTYNDAS